MEIPALDITFDQRELAEFERALREYPGVFRQAILPATEKTRVAMRRGIPKKLRETTTILPSVIGKAVRSKKATLTADGAQAEVRVASHRNPLFCYKMSPDSPVALRGVPVKSRPRLSYQLRQAGKTYGDRPYPDDSNLSSMFMAAVPSGHYGIHFGIFARKKDTGKLKEQFAPSVQYHLFDSAVLDELPDKWREYFLRTLRQEIEAHGAGKVRVYDRG